MPPWQALPGKKKSKHAKAKTASPSVELEVIVEEESPEEEPALAAVGEAAADPPTRNKAKKKKQKKTTVSPEVEPEVIAERPD